MQLALIESREQYYVSLDTYQVSCGSMTGAMAGSIRIGNLQTQPCAALLHLLTLSLNRSP